MGEISEFSGQYSDVLNRTAGVPVIITDRDRVISSSGIAKKEVNEKRISHSMETLMENRTSYVKTPGEMHPFLPLDNSELEAAIAYPIIGSGDISGSVIFLSGEGSSLPSETEIKLAQVAASFLGKQMEE